jgi:NADPH2:quinone reductase
MRAVIYDRVGPAGEVLQLVDLPEPHAGPGEVRVRIAWSGVNPSDVKSRAGLRSKTLPFPYITPHSDGSGIIDEVGGGVAKGRLGQRVWLWNAAWGRPNGTAAELVTLPAAQAVPLPDSTDLDVGACFGIPALTALHAVHMREGVTDKIVLIAGGAGAVGHYAIQFARKLGARKVVATVSNARKAELALAAGADAVIDYKVENVAARVRELTAGAGVDRVIEVDVAANSALDVELLRPGGDIVVYGSGEPSFSLPFAPLIYKNVELRFFIVYDLGAADRDAAVSTLTRLCAANELQHNIAARLPLERIVEAHESVEQGRVAGNVVVSVASGI